MESSDLRAIFLIEADEVLQALEQGLLGLEQNPTPDAINNLFRGMHTLKGSSGIVGCATIQRCAHLQEELLDALRGGKLSVTPAIAETLFQGHDLLTELLEGVRGGMEGVPGEEAKLAALDQRLMALLAGKAEAKGEGKAQVKDQGLAQPQPQSQAAAGEYDVHLDLDPDCLTRGLDPLALLRRVQALGWRINSLTMPTDLLPTLDQLDPAHLYLREIGLRVASPAGLAAAAALAALENLFEFARAEGSVHIAPVAIAPVAPVLSEVEGREDEEGERLWRGAPAAPEKAAPKDGSTKLGEIMVEQGALTPGTLEEALTLQNRPLGKVLVDEGLATPKQVARALTEQQSRQPQAGQLQGSVRIDARRLDSLADLVGELVIAQAQVEQRRSVDRSIGHAADKATSQLGKITRSIQSEVMAIRMVALGATFQKMTRIVRDHARASGKQIELAVAGEETELDKSLVDVIGDPLMHLIRNAVDHGIEPPDVRTARGKNPKGTIALSASHQGGNIVIEVRDDGKGLSKEAILTKATAMGLVSEGESLTDPQIYALIFHPGLSTAAKVTDVSGRGVGMDVVKKTIEGLRGRVEIDTVPGNGTTFRFTLPLTLAIIDGMLVQVGAQRYVIPTLSIEGSHRPRVEDVSTVQGRGELVQVRGGMLPLVRVHRFVGVHPRVEHPSDGIIVIVAYAGQRYALLVDDLLGQQQVVIKNLGEGFRRVKGVAGATVLGDGQVVLILDVGGLLEMVRA